MTPVRVPFALVVTAVAGTVVVGTVVVALLPAPPSVIVAKRPYVGEGVLAAGAEDEGVLAISVAETELDAWSAGVAFRLEAPPSGGLPGTSKP